MIRRRLHFGSRRAAALGARFQEVPSGGGQPTPRSAVRYPPVAGADQRSVGALMRRFLFRYIVHDMDTGDHFKCLSYRDFTTSNGITVGNKHALGGVSGEGPTAGPAIGPKIAHAPVVP